MNLGSVTNFFKRQSKTESANENLINKGDTAVIRSELYSGIEWPQYNPDDLIARKGSTIYRRMMIDEQCKAVIRLRRNAVTGRTWRFEPCEDLTEEQNEERIVLLHEVVRRIKGSFKNRLDGVMTALPYGFSLTEIGFDQFEHKGKVWVGIDKLRTKPFETFYFETDNFGNLLNVVQEVDNVKKKLDINKFIHYVQNIDDDEYYGRSELREAYRSWWSKDIVMRMHNIYLERAGLGFIYAQPTKGSGNKIVKGTLQYNDLMNVMNGLNVSTSAIFPEGLDITNIDFKDTELYERAIAMHNKAISKSLLMPDLLGISERGSTGSRALGDTQLEVLMWTLDNEAKTLAEVLNEQLFNKLGAFNWNDGLYPEFKFNDLSDDATQQLITNWRELVGAGAVDSNSEDQKHVRRLLEFPTEGDEENEDFKKNANSSAGLDAQQIAAMTDVISKVAQGQIPRETAQQILVVSFPISDIEADALLGEVGKTFEPKEIVSPGGVDEEGSDAGKQDEKGKTGTESNEEETKSAKPGKEKRTTDSSIQLGGATLRDTAFSLALKRVDFASIKEVTDKLEKAGTDELAASMDGAIKEMVNYVKSLPLKEPKETKTINFPKQKLSELKKTSRTILKTAWLLGTKNAKTELKTAKKENFSMSEHFTNSLEDVAVQYFEQAAFTMSGGLSSAATAIIKREVSNGIKTGKATKTVIQNIYKRLASDGLISLDVAMQALGEALETKNTDHRLATTVRTTTFEAINEARFAFFASDELDGFVEAIQYSAIMDSRTTEICSHLDDRIFSIKAKEWESYRPPNHFNCRSLLVPVTENDVWEASESPTVNPNQGFE